MLTIENLSVAFGGFRILRDVSFACEPGKVTAVIGPNGAGKTTLFDAVTGFIGSGGAAKCDGADVPSNAPHLVARAGLARTFQTPRLFEGMSVLENFMVAARSETPFSLALSALSRRGERLQNEKAYRAAVGWLDFLQLSRVGDNLASDLSGGQRKLVELGRALMTDPMYLLLDEPVAGVAPELVGEIGERLRDLANRGLGVLVIEHNMDFVMKFSDYVVVMVNGEILTEGSAETVRADSRVLEAYLGGVPA